MLCLGVPLCGQSWGFYAHQKINYHAVFMLPPEMLTLFKPHIDFLAAHAVDPDKRRYMIQEEGPRHYIDMDHYGPPPYASLPREWKKAVAACTADSLQQYGIAPWWIQVMLERLTTAFRQRSPEKILQNAAEIGHYIADIHVPLHACSNHNGQLTGQQGIHGFWESRLPELLAEKKWDFLIGPATYVKRPLDLIWKKTLQSAAAADTVLQLERVLRKRFASDRVYAYEERNGQVVRQYSTDYALAYDQLLTGMVERRMRASIETVASFWLTAWIDAGQPSLALLARTPLLPEWTTTLDQLQQAWKNNSIKGREHD